MPFEVTATRKRPQTFEQLAGQNFVAATLISSLEQGRIAHAYLFSGPRGCGKTSTARILAKALNCEHGPSPSPCGTCASCTAISSGTSLDVIEIDGASNTSVDNIRQIKDEVLFAPNASRYKIYIIDEVHMLSLNAFNALLKTIEEPPPYVVFIFATTEPHKVPATIKSRCQQFNFRLVPVETILQLLKQAAAETGIEAEEEALLWIAREAAGSVRDAYTLFDQIASFSGQIITAQNIRDTLGLVGIDQLNALFCAIAQNNAKSAFEILDGILARGVSSEQFLTDAVDYCRSTLLLLYGVQKEGLLSGPRSNFEPVVLQSLSVQQLEFAIGVLLDTYRHLKETVDPRYEVELAIAKLSHIGSYISPSELFDAVRSLQKGWGAASGIPVASGAPTEPETPATTRPSREGATQFPFRDRSKDEEPQAAPLLRDLSSRLTRNQPTTAQNEGPIKAPSAPDAVAANDQREPTESGAPAGNLQAFSPNELRKKIISKLKAQNLFLASALEKSGEWVPKHNGYIIPVLNRVEMDLISRFSSLIAEAGASILGTPCIIEVQSAKNLGHSAAQQNGHPTAAISSPQTAPVPGQVHENTADQQTNLAAQREEVSTPSPSILPGQKSKVESAFVPHVPPGDPQRETAHPTDEKHHPVDSYDSAEGISEEDVHIVEAVRKLFKGKLVASVQSPARRQETPEPQPSVAPSQLPSQAFSEDSEDYFNSEEDYD